MFAGSDMPINLLSANHRECLECSDAGHPGDWRSGVEGRGMEHWKLRPGLAIVLSLMFGFHKRMSRLLCGVSFIYLSWAAAKQ